MAKYGTFMKTEDFGSKFFCGKKLTPFPEPPLHYMQGKQWFIVTELSRVC